ncbi:uncharacterized protein PV07_02612 [Cladophialophora immunda]|uniref:Uncharacterized protein n=1 Tax=Cladophialophora immunda TaxID=569365 RepID=A0A0D1ZS92_9EURO|nr:uncharacterized protein PV07_02612 [Cladophialophora immunda]KIW30921.1 hypothetical protein PV07_02612 [Cladophialophora immunda]
MSSSNSNPQNTTPKKVERTTNGINTKDDNKDGNSQASNVDGDSHRQIMQDAENVHFPDPITQEARQRIGWQEQK